MGCFAFICQDTGRPTYSNNDAVPEDVRQTVHMVDPRDGTDYVERSYADYGEYGGRDYFELMADLNKEYIKANYGKWNPDHETIEKLFSKNWKALTEKELQKKRHFGVIIYFDSWSMNFDMMENPDDRKELEKLYSHEPGFACSSEWDSFVHRYERSLEVKNQLYYPILVEDYNRWPEFAKKGCVSKSDPNQVTVHPAFEDN